jgi:hypothetical protein
VVVDGWSGVEHHQPSKSSVFRLILSIQWVERSNIVEHARQLVREKSGNIVTFPIGLSLSKVQKLGRLPVRFAIQGQYMPVHPDAFGQKWNLQVTVAPVIPKLIRGNVLGD